MENFLKINNQTISYVEKNAHKTKTLFFFHGNSGSAESWSKQFSDPVLSDYRLVAFDLPAHGNSASFTTHDKYNILFLAELMVEALQGCLYNEEYVLVSFSLGTNLVAEMLKHNIYPKGIVLISPTIIGEGILLNDIGLPGFNPEVLFRDECDAEALDEYVRLACMNTSGSDQVTIREDYRKVKDPFRSMLLKTAMEGLISNEIELLNSYASGPLLIMFGREEQIIKPDYLDEVHLPVWNNTIYKIPGASHFVHIDQPEATNHLLANYCRSYLHSFSNVSGNP